MRARAHTHKGKNHSFDRNIQFYNKNIINKFKLFNYILIKILIYLIIYVFDYIDKSKYNIINFNNFSNVIGLQFLCDIISVSFSRRTKLQYCQSSCFKF